MVIMGFGEKLTLILMGHNVMTNLRIANVADTRSRSTKICVHCCLYVPC